MEIRNSTDRDIPAIMGIIDAAKAFFRENGIDQWQNGSPNPEIIGNDVKNGESYVVCDSGIVLATAMISLRGEPTYAEIYDGAWLNGGPYGVIHRVAVSPSVKKSGLASSLVGYAVERTLEKGFSSLRADTHDDNLPMQRMLSKNGFVFCGNIFLADGAPRRAYEKILKQDNAPPIIN